MAFDDHKFPKQRDLSAAFAVLCRELGGHTPNSVAKTFSLDRKTARNAIDEKAGVPVITKSLQARQKAQGDHYALWLALGEMIFGETLDEYEERRLQALIESTENARKLVDERNARRQELRARAAA